MATKSSTIFSTNPKMDTSGIKAKMLRMSYDMDPLPPKEIPGGELYMRALREEVDFNKTQTLTNIPKLKQAAKIISNNTPVYTSNVEYVNRCSDWE